MNKFSISTLSLLLPLLIIGCGGDSSNTETNDDVVMTDPNDTTNDDDDVVITDPNDTTNNDDGIVITDPNDTTNDDDDIVITDPNDTTSDDDDIVITDPNDTTNDDDESSDSYGYLSEPKFTLSAQACITSLSEQAFNVNDGVEVSTLASSDLSCSQVNDGNNLIYSVSWNGNDFNRDGEKDTLTFDVRVESFTDSTFSYSELVGQSSMTQLGSASALSYWVDEDDPNVSVWDVKGDTESGVNKGQSLRFNVENIAVSLSHYRVVFNGFNTINIVETKGGREHTHIRGQGTELDSGTTDGSDKFTFDPVDTFVITGAGDYYDNNIWGISDIQFSFSLDNPDLASANSAEWLAGSWGITFPVYGGERLDTEVDNGYDLRAGAKEIVTELPAVGHIITNLSYFAHSYYFTLRQNDNVDIANEIHESLVPTLENEKIILDVLQTFKDADKKIILYISTNYMERASDEAQAAWQIYYTNQFGGDEYLAYKDLIQGFVARFKDYADGYWLDTTTILNDDGKLQDFINMIKETDPTSIVTANQTKNYFSENGVSVLIDSDGVDDADETDYKIVLHEPLNTFQDFTNGHVTPLGQGAPPNSWGYEEYTLPNMINAPWATYDGKSVLKHAWFPVREKWHVPTVPLVFGTEQAYRFVKNVIDGNASITFATTTAYSNTSNPGHIMVDEMDIMKEINARLMMEIPPEPETYTRPEGASLVIIE